MGFPRFAEMVMPLFSKPQRSGHLFYVVCAWISSFNAKSTMTGFGGVRNASMMIWGVAPRRYAAIVGGNSGLNGRKKTVVGGVTHATKRTAADFPLYLSRNDFVTSTVLCLRGLFDGLVAAECPCSLLTLIDHLVAVTWRGDILCKHILSLF